MNNFTYDKLLAKINDNRSYDMIVIEGVVGVGKSSLMNIMTKLGYKDFKEPVLDNPILDKFYYNRSRYAFVLQVFFLNKRFEHIKQADKINNAVMDRSIYGDAIFARLLNLNDEMSNEEFEIYQELLENMLEHVKRPKLMIYLKVSVDEAMRRINKRGRDYEQVVEREYWEKLNKEYHEYFKNYKLSPILEIDVDNLDFENNPDDQKYVLNLIQEKIESLKTVE